jgi:anti-sigma factor RsiW
MRESEMNIERLSEIVEAYGGDPLRWPEAERLAAQALAARDPRAAALVAEAEALDLLFDAVPAPAPSAALTARVLARAPRPSLWRELFPGMPAWRPALGFALALAVGVGVQSAAADRLGLVDADALAASDSADSDDGTLTPLSGTDQMSEEDVL